MSRLAVAVLLMLGALVFVASPASAAPFANGSFEDPSNDTTNYVIKQAGQTIGPWTVTGNSVDWLGDSFAQSDGVQSIELAGSPGPGGVTQTFDTVAGRTYTVDYDVAKRSGCAASSDVRAFVNRNSNPTPVNTFTFASSAPGNTFTRRTFTFTATGAQTALAFDTTVGGSNFGCGTILDNVRVIASSALQTCSAEEVRATQRYWYFGNRANIDFGVSGTTATAGLSPATAGDVLEGTTVVTDTAGNLQFWSDGQRVLNRHSVVMPNGAGLDGASSATQTVAAFPSSVPGRYFVVTNSTVTPMLGTLKYSIVDMTLNGGLGDVTTKNVQLGMANTAGEALNAIPNADGTGFWVLTFQPSTTTNLSRNLLAYEFGGNGPVGSVVVSKLSTDNPNGLGTITISPDLKRLALVIGASGGVQTGQTGQAHVLDFNADTGVATDTLAWTLPAGDTPYSMDFSPSGDYVYVSRIFNGGELVRYRIAGATSGAQVLATQESLGTAFPGTPSPTFSSQGGAVRRGPDGRMYMANRDQTVLGVVTDPDAVTPTFDNDGFALAPGSVSEYGLPQTVTGCDAPVAPAPARAAVVASSVNWSLGTGLPGTSTIGFAYGERPLVPLMGDWDGNGTITVGYLHNPKGSTAGPGDAILKLNNQNDSSAPDITFNFFGDPRGYAVAGDYDGDGYDDVAVYRAGKWEIDYLGPGAPANATFTLGAPFATGTYPNTIPVAGDWDGDGIDGIGTYDYATGTWVLKNVATAGGPDIGPFVFWGGSGSYPVVGDFGGIGRDTPGYRVGTIWTARTAAVTSGATITFDFEVANSVPFTW